MTISSVSNAQEKYVTGFLFPSLSIGDSTSMDFFLITEVDSSLSLKDNLLKVRSDTLIRVSLGNSKLASIFHVKNEVTGSIVQMVPLRIIWSVWMLEDNFLHTSVFTDFPISIMGNRIVDGYDASRVRSFAQLSTINTKR